MRCSHDGGVPRQVEQDEARGRTRSCAPRRRTRSRRAARARPEAGTGRPRCRAVPSTRSSWKTPVASCARRLSAVWSASSVSRCATKTSVFSPRLASSRAPCSASHAMRGSSASAAPRRRARAASGAAEDRRRSAAPEASARRSGPRLLRGARRRAAPARARIARSSASRVVPPPRADPLDRHGRRAAAARRCRRAASSWCTAEAARCAAEARLERPRPPGTRPAAAAGAAGRTRATSSSSGDRGEQQDVAAQRRDRRDRAVRRVAGMAGRAAEAVRLVHDQQVDAGLDRAPAVSSGRATSVSSATTTRRWASNGLKSRAEVARDVGEPLLVEQHEDLVVLPPQLAQPLHGQRLGRDHETPLGAARADEVVQDQARLDGLAEARPRRRAASAPGRRAVARSAAWSWCGKRRMRPPRNEPRPSASRSEARCSASRRSAKSSTGSRSPLARRSTRSDLGSVGPGSSGARDPGPTRRSRGAG